MAKLGSGSPGNLYLSRFANGRLCPFLIHGIGEVCQSRSAVFLKIWISARLASNGDVAAGGTF